MSQSEPAPPPPVAVGGAITGVVVFAVVTWIILGAYVLKLPSYFTALLLFWYWTTVGQTDFRRLPSTILGALVGLALIWALRTLSVHLGGWGLLLGGSLIALAIFVDIMRWAPLVVNSCTLLFTTVAGIPILMNAANFIEVGESMLIGALYLSAIAWIAIRLAPKPRV